MSLTLLLGWLIAVAAALLPLLFIAARRLRIVRDWFFLLFYYQGCIYLDLSPMLYLMAPDPEAWAVVPDDETRWLYLLMQVAVLVLFQVPFLLLYARQAHRTRASGQDGRQLVLRPRRVALLSVFSIAFGLLFLYVSITTGLFRFHADYGSSGLIFLLVALPTPVYAAIRFFETSGLFVGMVMLTIVLHRHQLPRGTRMLVLIGCGLTLGTWILFFLFNGGRMLPALAVALAVGVVIVTYPAYLARLKPRLKAGLLVGFLLAIYLLRISYNIRFGFDQGFSLGMLNPFDSSYLQTMSTVGIDNFRFRLNGLDGMVRITPEALQQGYAWGEGWRDLAYVSLVQWIDRAAVEPLKLQRSTDPKMYLIYRYTPYTFAIDWPCSLLFDLYGNLSFLGLLVGAWVFAKVYALIRRLVASPMSGIGLTVGLLLMVGTKQFEPPFAVWFFGFLPMAPIFLAIVLLRPFRVQAVTPTAAIAVGSGAGVAVPESAGLVGVGGLRPRPGAAPA